MSSQLTLHVLPGTEYKKDNCVEGLKSIYVGETVTLCLIINPYNYSDQELDGLSVVLEKFCVTESRRLYSDSTSNIERMRSVDSLLSEDGSRAIQSTSNDSNRGQWNMVRDDGRLICTRPFTAQPLSDDSLNLQCKFVVSVQQSTLTTSSKSENIDPFVMHYITKDFGGISDKVVANIDIGAIELPVILCNPVRVNKRIVPVTSTLCTFMVEMESTEEDTIVNDMLLSIIPIEGPVQTGSIVEQAFTCSADLSKFPLHVGILGDNFEWRIQKAADSSISSFKSKLVVVVEPEPNRKCTMTFESPFDVATAFLPSQSDDFTVEFACEETAVKLGDRIRVSVAIKNRTEKAVNLSFKFPLIDKKQKQQDYKVSDPKNIKSDELFQFIKCKLAEVPGFVCMEAERNIGTINAFTHYRTSFEYEAINLGRRHIPTVTLVDNETGKTVVFVKFLELTVTL